MNEPKLPTERPKLSAAIQHQIAELHASRPLRRTLRETRGKKTRVGLSGIDHETVPRWRLKEFRKRG